jgi:hypothetical protein
LPIQTHHILSDKHSTKWTAKFEEIVHPYGLSLEGNWNTVDIPHYQKGGHPAGYHEWVYDQLESIYAIAQDDRQKFLELFNERIKKQVEEHPEMLFEDWWQ